MDFSKAVQLEKNDLKQNNFYGRECWQGDRPRIMTSGRFVSGAELSTNTDCGITADKDKVQWSQLKSPLTVFPDLQRKDELKGKTGPLIQAYRWVPLNSNELNTNS